MKHICVIIFSLCIFGSIYASADDKPNKEKELSYKTGKPEPRYMTMFNPQELMLPADKSAEIPEIGVAREKIVNLLLEAAKAASGQEWFPKIENETVLFLLRDLGNARFTLKIDKSNFLVMEGFDPNDTPTMVIPLITHNLEDLAEIFSDGVMTYEEQYRIFYFITIPGLQAIYRNEMFYKPGDKTNFKFDNLVHLIIPAEEEVLFTGIPRSIEATILNVDGQWLLLRGLHGDPDFRINATLDQAAKLYQLAFYEVRKIKSTQQAKEVSDKFLEFLDSMVDYTRADHLEVKK